MSKLLAIRTPCTPTTSMPLCTVRSDVEACKLCFCARFPCAGKAVTSLSNLHQRLGPQRLRLSQRETTSVLSGNDCKCTASATASRACWRRGVSVGSCILYRLQHLS